MKKPKEPKQELTTIPPPARSLQSFSDYVDLVQDVINGIFDKTVTRQDAHTIAILTGYGVQALREARGGKTQMTVFLQDMHKNKIKVDMLSQEEMDRFLQGTEDVQMEVLQQLEAKGGLIECEARVIPKQEPKAKLDTKLISGMSGITQEKIQDVFKVESGVCPETSPVLKHEWAKSLGGNVNFCINCGLERHILTEVDKTGACSGEWNLT